MEETIISPFSYIAEQIKAFVLNRLALEPSTTQQLASSFSLLVDGLSISESSIDHVLDALYKAKIVDFEYKNDVRYYKIINFEGDNIFELSLYIVEKLVIENNVPYYEGSEPSKDDDLYFEKIGQNICIEINKPITVPDVVLPEVEQSNSAENENSDDNNEEIQAENKDENVEKEQVIVDNSTSNGIVNNRTIDYSHSKEVNQSSYNAMGNTTETDDIINGLFAQYLSNKPKEEPTTKEEKVDEEAKEEPIENKESIGDNIVFTSEIIIDSPKISPEEEKLRIENALRKLDEYSNPKPTRQEEKTIEQSEESVENSEISADTEETEEQVVTPDFSNKHVDITPKNNGLNVRAYIEEQEQINNYDWQKKLSRVFVDADNDLEEEVNAVENNVIVSTYSELKDIMEKKNYKFKAYSNYDSVSFYSQNYVFSNRLIKDTSIYTYFFMLLEIVLAYFLVDKYIGKGFVPYIVVAVCLLAIPLVFILNYFSFKDKRKPANFHFSISIVTALMIYVNLMVMVVLLAFFVPSLNVSVSNVSSMITTVFYPAGLLLAIPFSVCVYSILYSTKRYHLH